MNRDLPFGIVALALYLILNTSRGWSQTTAFTYQGRLFEGTTPATGLYDLRFTLHSDALRATPVAAAVELGAVPVTNGLFAVNLDFGSVFDGSARWLELAERAHGTAAFVTLAPRQFLTSVPHAAYAANAGRASSVAPGAINAQAIAPGAVGAGQLAPGAAAANLLQIGQSPVGAGGMILSPDPHNTNLSANGYSKVGSMNLVAERWIPHTNGPPYTGTPPQQRTNALLAYAMGAFVMWGGKTEPNVGKPGILYYPAEDAWVEFGPGPADPAPPEKPLVLAVDDTKVLIWGYSANKPHGLRHDLKTGSWEVMPTNNAPDYRVGAVARQCGKSILVWVPAHAETATTGNITDLRTEIVRYLGYGRKFDMGIGSWKPMNATGAPDAIAGSTVVWSGSRLVVWGGFRYEIQTYSHIPGFSYVRDLYRIPTSDGAVYDPFTDTWAPISTVGAPSPRFNAAGAWAANQLVVWGGQTLDVAEELETQHRLLATGGRYDPSLNRWSPMQAAPITAPRSEFTLTAMGDRVMVWGGNTAPADPYTGAFLQSKGDGTGASYFPASDSWSLVSNFGSPSPRFRHSALWNGSQVFVWGGLNFDFDPQVAKAGALYQPQANTWRPVNINEEPGARTEAAAVWTGTEMLVWGGRNGSKPLQSGGRFEPHANVWRTLTYNQAPAPRHEHTAVWSGTEMIVWGGRQGTTPVGTGGRYNPSTDQWAPLPNNGAPSARYGHTAVWTGAEMLIWGGENGEVLADGAAYDPRTDQWRPIPAATAPRARSLHSAVWTGREMIIWGGRARFQFWRPPPASPLVGETVTDEGARYDPSTGTWTALPIQNAPQPRSSHVALWTGRTMLVWGGTNDTGGLSSTAWFDPASDTWTAISPPNPLVLLPNGRERAFWCGTVMVVLRGGAWGTGGAVYSPAADRWTAITENAFLGPRTGYTGCYTGQELLLHGGGTQFYPATDTTYGYIPTLDAYLYLRP